MMRHTLIDMCDAWSQKKHRISHQWVDDCLRNYGHVLLGDGAHWCRDWDYLPIDENSPEMDCCTCPHVSGNPLTPAEVVVQ